jgi:hypothetical protein
MAESATFALKAGVWFRRGRLLIVSPDSLGTACPLSGRNSTYRPVQISAAGSLVRDGTKRAHQRAAFLKLVCLPPKRIGADCERDQQDQNPDDSDVAQDGPAVRLEHVSSTS